MKANVPVQILLFFKYFYINKIFRLGLFNPLFHRPFFFCCLVGNVKSVLFLLQIIWIVIESQIIEAKQEGSL